MNLDKSLNHLDKIYENSVQINIDDVDKIVIFSDLHLGNGSRKDDFAKNATDFEFVLKNHYYKKNFQLILNGDIEELYKFKYDEIRSKWKSIYDIFDQFESSGRLIRVEGNHDFALKKIFSHQKKPVEIHEGLRLNYQNEHIFIYHGHQTSNFLETHNKFSQFCVRHIGKHLFIKNSSVSLDSMKKFITEVRAYEFSVQNKIISILGHTHRALFESLSKKDDLLYKIEKLIDKYSKVAPEKQVKIQFLIRNYMTEIAHIHKENKNNNLRSGIYNEQVLVPCLFNSGSVVGKRGFTAIEINRGKIALVYWFDSKKSQRYLDYKGVKVKNINGTDYYRAKVKEESLDYVFTRIKLLC